MLRNPVVPAYREWSDPAGPLQVSDGAGHLGDAGIGVSIAEDAAAGRPPGRPGSF